MSIWGTIKSGVTAAVKYNPVTLSTRAVLGAAKVVPGLNRVASPVSRLVDAATLNSPTAPKRPATVSRGPQPQAGASASQTVRAATVGTRNTAQSTGTAIDPTVLAARRQTSQGSGGKGDTSLWSQIGAALTPSKSVVPSGGAPGGFVQGQSFAADGGALPGGGSAAGTGADALYNALDAAAQGGSGYGPPQQRFNDPSAGAPPFAYGGGSSGGGGGGGGGYAFDPGPSTSDYAPPSDQVDVSYSDDGVAIPDHMYDSQATEAGDDEGDATMYFQGLAGIGSDITSGLKSFGGDVAKEGAQRLAEGAAKKLQTKGKSSPKKEYEVQDKPMSGAKKVVIGAAVAAPLLIVGSRLLHHKRR